MAFNSDSVQNASLQRGEDDIEVWETGARFTERQDPVAGGQVQTLEESDEDDLGDHRNHDLGVDRLMPVKVGQEEMYEPVDNSKHAIADHHLHGSEDTSERRAASPPTWLSNAALRQKNPSLNDGEITGHAGRGMDTTASRSHSTYTHLFSVQGVGLTASSSQHRPLEEHGRKANDQSDFDVNRQQSRVATDLNLSTAHGRSSQPPLEPSSSHPPAAASVSHPEEPNKADRDTAMQDPEWEEARRRCLIVTHPLYPQMLAKHAACLQVGTPVDLLPDIEAQLMHAPEVTEKYRVLRDQITDVSPEEQADLDRFMVEYPFALGALEKTLEHHVCTAVTEAMMSCWDLEQELYNLTGARPVPGNGATMSDDDDEDDDNEDYGTSIQDCNDSGAYGPLVPSESERTLMERVRQELKLELKQGYKTKLEDVREEILRKRKAGKLPEGTTEILKNWWDAHANWPYPTEEEKEILTTRTGLEMRQVNNWFINQRKRKWQGNPMISPGQAIDPKGKVRKSK